MSGDEFAFFAVTGVGILFAVLAVLLESVTSAGQSRGFRISPSGDREWHGYWLRTLVLTLLAGIILFWFEVKPALALSMIAISSILSLIGSATFWKDDRQLRSVGVWAFIITVLHGFLISSVS